MTTLDTDRLLGSPAPVQFATTLADLLDAAGGVIDGLGAAELARRTATIDALASELAMAAGLHALVGNNASVTMALRTLGAVSARTAGRTVTVDPEQAGLIRTILAQF